MGLISNEFQVALHGVQIQRKSEITEVEVTVNSSWL
jgi:hypothetical protein